ARQEVEARRPALGRGARRGERTAAEAEPGRLILVRRGGAPALAMVLGVHSIRSHRVLIEALLPHGATVRVKSGVIKRIFWATPPLHVPRDGGRQTREDGLRRRGVRRRQLEHLRGAYWQEFLQVVETLEQFGAVRDHKLEPKGRLIAGLRHDNELLVAESVTQGIFDNVSAPEAAAICSMLIEEARSGDPAVARLFLKKRPKLKRKLDQLARIADIVHDAQRARHLNVPAGVHPGFVPSVY